MTKLNALIVIYNKKLADSATIRSLNFPEDVSVLIADNSTLDNDNQAFAQAHGFKYIDMRGNKGLSQAYNHVINMLDKDDGLICLFDDDTTVGNGYFKALEAAVSAHPGIDIFAPVVMDSKGILSPCAINGAVCRRVKSLNDLPQHGVSVVNSGLAIRLKVFQDYRYDEGQFLDYIDHAFIRDITGHELSKIDVMKETVLQQCFSGSEKQSRKAGMERYQIFKKDVEYFCRKYEVSPLSRLMLLGKRRIKLLLSKV